MDARKLRIAAIQLQTRIGDVAHNLGQTEKLATEAFRAGAQVVALPEFFTGALIPNAQAFDTALPANNRAVALMRRLAKSHGGRIGGSMLVADGGELFNRYYFVEPDGSIHSHDKDIPTMWENAFYTGGNDDGVFETGLGRVGAAVCWELIRHRTVERMCGKVDLVMTGTHWWGIPWNWPGSPRTKAKAHERNATMSEQAPVEFARRVGAPVVQASHCGELKGDFFLFPRLNIKIPYETSFVGCTQVVDASGTVIASRNASEGPGVVTGVVEVGASTAPAAHAANGDRDYWIPRLAGDMKFFSAYQSFICKGLYRRSGRQRGLAAARAVELAAT